MFRQYSCHDHIVFQPAIFRFGKLQAFEQVLIDPILYKLDIQRRFNRFIRPVITNKFPEFIQKMSGQIFRIEYAGIG